MTTKLRSIFKRHVSHSDDKNVENSEKSSAVMREMKNVPPEVLRRRKEVKSMDNEIAIGDDIVPLRKARGARRTKTSLGAIEDLLQCPICNDRLKSPRMLPCQHTFCQLCLHKQLDDEGKFITCPLCKLQISDRTPDLLPTNLYIESLLNVMENPGENWLRLATNRPAVSFAPLPNRGTLDLEMIGNSDLSSFCQKCSIECGRENRCKHCKQFFCTVCWTDHINELKNQLGKIVTQMETMSDRFVTKIDEFAASVEEAKDLIYKDIEAKIAELTELRDRRMKVLVAQADRGRESAKEVQQRIEKISHDVKEQINGSYDGLEDNNSKVKVFMGLHRAATELMNLESSWSPEIGERSEENNSNMNDVDVMSTKGDISLFYRKKVFSSKFIVTRELVQRPSGMSYDPWRDHVFVACPGARQIVVLDRKYKLFKTYQSPDMMAPQGVAYSESTEELYVTDKWKHCIVVFNRKGEISRKMCKKGLSKGQLTGPEGLAIHGGKKLLYVADTGNDRIQVLEFNGAFHGFIGAAETRANSVSKNGKILDVVVNHLNQPTDVAVTDDCVIVADCGNHKVKIFNHEGVVVHSIGGAGTLRRHFRSPEVVYADSKGNILVGDSGNARVQIFSQQGELLRTLGGKTSETNKFGWISGILVKNNFDMLISDNRNNIIRIF